MKIVKIEGNEIKLKKDDKTRAKSGGQKLKNEWKQKGKLKERGKSEGGERRMKRKKNEERERRMVMMVLTVSLHDANSILSSSFLDFKLLF